MRYVLLTYNSPDALEAWKALTESERRAEEDEYVRLASALAESDAYVAANEFEPSTPARTVRVRNGTRSVTDGPAVAGDESLTGYFLIEVDTDEAAIEWAAKIPNARNGSVEIRRVDEGELAERMASAGTSESDT